MILSELVLSGWFCTIEKADCYNIERWYNMFSYGDGRTRYNEDSIWLDQNPMPEV